MRRLFGIILLFGCMAGCGDSPRGGGGTDAAVPDAARADAARADAGCSSDLDCQDGVFCNGPERCDSMTARCVPAGAGACLPSQMCDEPARECRTNCMMDPDADGDGVNASACGGTDCDDTDRDTFPMNREVCDASGHDEDCNDSTMGSDDLDDDGVVSDQCCQRPITGLVCGADCDDASAARRPGATEVCNGADDNCDGATDEGLAIMLWADCDGDGSGGTLVEPRLACPSDPAGCTGGGGTLVTDGRDCNDENPMVGPSAIDVCNGVDDDCDMMTDEPASATCTLPAATATCASGACAIAMCDAGFGDCNTMAPDGCEVSLDTPAACGACGVTCPVTCNALMCDGAVQISAGPRTCVVLASGRIACWGLERLGDGSSSDSATLVFASGITNAVSVDVGNGHVCAVLASGQIRCWGSNSWGQLGTASSISASRPELVTGITNGVSVSAGEDHTCAALMTGEVRCWGRNGSGQLGDGTTTDSRPPVTVLGITDAIEVAVGYNFSCALRRTGAVMCWGDAFMTGLGPTPPLDTRSPSMPAVGVTNAIAITGGVNTACVLRMGGQMACWGNTPAGFFTVPTDVAGLTDATRIDAGWNHLCAVRTGGATVCWGDNGAGRLGDGTTTDRTDPVAVSGVLDGVDVAGGLDHTCVIRAGGAVWCWGSDASGQLGDGTIRVPFTVSLPQPILAR